MSATDINVLETLRGMKCGTPLFPNFEGSVFHVSDKSTVYEVIIILQTKKISSVPVVSSQTGVAIAVISVLDLLAYLLSVIPSSGYEEFWSANASSIQNRPVLALKDVGELDPLLAISSDQSVLEAAQMMLDNKAHRVVVYDAQSGRLVNLITLSRVLQAVYSIADAIPITKRSVLELRLNLGNVVTVKTTSRAYDAFQLMRTHRISGVAVVNAQGRLVGNISASDIIQVDWIGSRFIHLLMEGSVQDFVKAARSQDAKPSRIYITLRKPLKSAIKLAVLYGVHRVYIVDDDYKPIGVLSLSDMLKLILQ